MQDSGISLFGIYYQEKDDTMLWLTNGNKAMKN
jgi:hypothetical protein